MPLFIPFGESPFMYVSINNPHSGVGLAREASWFFYQISCRKKLRILNSLSVRIRGIYTKRPHSSTNELCGRLVLLITYYLLLLSYYLLILQLIDIHNFIDYSINSKTSNRVNVQFASYVFAMRKHRVQ